MKIRKIYCNRNNDWLNTSINYYNDKNIIKNIILIQKYIRSYILKKNIEFNKLKKNIIGEWRYIHNFKWPIYGFSYTDYCPNWIDEWNLTFYEDNNTIKGTVLYNSNETKKWSDFMSCISEDDKERQKYDGLEFYVENNKKIYEKEYDCFFEYKNKEYYKTIKSEFNNFLFNKNKLKFNYFLWIDKNLNNNIKYEFDINENFDYMKMVVGGIHSNQSEYFFNSFLNIKKEKKYSYLLVKILKKNILLDRSLKKLYLSKLKICDDILYLINFFILIDEKYYDKNIIKIQKFYKHHCYYDKFNDCNKKYIINHWNTYVKY